MRLEVPREMERFGANLFYGVQKVFELDAGLRCDVATEQQGTIKQLTYEHLHSIEQDMVIVVPMKGEQLKLLQGVLYGIPNQCLIIIVSNSSRDPVDRFSIEQEAIKNFCDDTGKKIMLVHQKDAQFATALARAGYPELVGEDGLVRNGKAEGMIMGTLLARLTGRKYLGFIDADNFFPGAVLEYVRIYSAGFALSKSDYAMVRIAWHSKPKIVDSKLFFAKFGRTSVVTNSYMNQLLSHYTGFETDVIRTGNAGEHAMTTDLAESMVYSSGYSVEPYHLLYLMEKFGGVTEKLTRETVQHPVEVFQIESRNPHLHAEKGTEHVNQMIYAALQVIYHSSVSSESLKATILEDLRERKLLAANADLPKTTYYPALSKVNLTSFVRDVQDNAYSDFFEARGMVRQTDNLGYKDAKPSHPATTRTAVQPALTQTTLTQNTLPTEPLQVGSTSAASTMAALPAD